MSYKPFVFKIYIAASTHNMDQWIEAAENAVDEYNSEQEIFRFDIEGQDFIRFAVLTLLKKIHLLKVFLLFWNKSNKMASTGNE